MGTTAFGRFGSGLSGVSVALLLLLRVGSASTPVVAAFPSDMAMYSAETKREDGGKMRVKSKSGSDGPCPEFVYFLPDGHMHDASNTVV